LYSCYLRIIYVGGRGGEQGEIGYIHASLSKEENVLYKKYVGFA
jgi:hypothetical protein